MSQNTCFLNNVKQLPRTPVLLSFQRESMKILKQNRYYLEKTIISWEFHFEIPKGVESHHWDYQHSAIKDALVLNESVQHTESVILAMKRMYLGYLGYHKKQKAICALLVPYVVPSYAHCYSETPLVIENLSVIQPLSTACWIHHS